MKLRWITVGRDTQITLDTSLSVAIELSEHKIARLVFFLNRAEALEAVGLAE